MFFLASAGAIFPGGGAHSPECFNYHGNHYCHHLNLFFPQVFSQPILFCFLKILLHDVAITWAWRMDHLLLLFVQRYITILLILILKSHTILTWSVATTYILTLGLPALYWGWCTDYHLLQVVSHPSCTQVFYHKPGSLRVLCNIFAVPITAIFWTEVSEDFPGTCRATSSVYGVTAPITKGTTVSFTFQAFSSFFLDSLIFSPILQDVRLKKMRGLLFSS